MESRRLLASIPITLYIQGIDLEAGGRNKQTHRTAPKSENVYLKLLVKVRLVWLEVHSCKLSKGEYHCLALTKLNWVGFCSSTASL